MTASFIRGVIIVAVFALLAACAATGKDTGIDVRPIGRGLEFLGLAGVLSALILVFGRSLPVMPWFPRYGSALLAVLFVVLTAVVGATAMPKLVVPLLAALAAAAVVAVLWRIGR